MRITDPNSPDPYQRERKIILEGSLLLIRDTPDNIKRAEQILQDRDLLAKIYSKKLDIGTFNLSPVNALEESPELVEKFTKNLVEMIEVMLYTQDGVIQAKKEGRRMWFDPNTKQLTITDYPENLAAVGAFIESLPQIKKKTRSKIIFLEHALASDLSGQLEEFLGISPAEPTAGGGGAGTQEVTKTLRTGSSSGNEFTWRDLTLRVTRVNDNDVNDDTDNDVEIIARTPGNSQTLTIKIWETDFVGDYEITAQDVKPSSTSGEGRAKLKIRYYPAGQGGGYMGGGAGMTGGGRY